MCTTCINIFYISKTIFYFFTITNIFVKPYVYIPEMATITSGQATSGFINLNWVCKLNLYCFNHHVVLLFTFVIANMKTKIHICKL